MSIDWDAVCLKCNVAMHLGQRMGGQSTFGYGSTDEAGRREVADFIDEHLGHDLRIKNCEAHEVPYLKDLPPEMHPDAPLILEVNGRTYRTPFTNAEAAGFNVSGLHGICVIRKADGEVVWHSDIERDNNL